MISDEKLAEARQENADAAIVALQPGMRVEIFNSDGTPHVVMRVMELAMLVVHPVVDDDDADGDDPLDTLEPVQ